MYSGLLFKKKRKKVMKGLKCTKLFQLLLFSFCKFNIINKLMTAVWIGISCLLYNCLEEGKTLWYRRDSVMKVDACTRTPYQWFGANPHSHPFVAYYHQVWTGNLAYMAFPGVLIVLWDGFFVCEVVWVFKKKPGPIKPWLSPNPNLRWLVTWCWRHLCR